MIKYLKDQYNVLKDSIKELDARTTIITLYELIFFLISGVSFMIFASILKKKSVFLSTLDLENLMTLSKSEVDFTHTTLKKFIATVIIGTILLIIIIFLSMAIIKVMIWFKTADKKFKKEDILRFIPVRFVWLLIEFGLLIILFLPLFITIGFSSNINSAPLALTFSLIALILFLALMTIKNLMYIFYIESKNITCIKKAFKFGLKKIHHYIVPYIIILVLLIVVSQLYWIYQFFPEKLVNLITLIIYILFAVWTRFYFLKVTKSIKK